MKILLVGSAGVYGAQLSLLCLCKDLKKQGVEVGVVLPEVGEMQRLLCNNGIDTFIIKNGLEWYDPNVNLVKKNIVFLVKRCLNWIAEYKINKIIENNNYDIIHMNSIGVSVGARTAIKLKKKLIWHIREFVQEDLARKLYFSKKTYSLVNQADSIITISKSVYDKYSKILTNPNLYIIADGVDLEEYYVENHEILHGNKVKIIFSGRICKEKGQYLLIDALKYLKDYIDIMDVEFIGDGNGNNSEINRLREITRNNPAIYRNVIFSGYCKNVKEKLANADICVVASQMEAYGRVTVEAMLAGALVVGADTGGTAELLSGGNGLIFEHGNAQNLAYKIKSILDNPEKARKIALDAQVYATTHYSSEIAAEKIIELYND